MVKKNRPVSANQIWTYAYKIVPPQAAERLRAIKALLEHAHSDAVRGARTWTGRVVLEERGTHILIVSDSPSQNHEVNHRLEAALTELQVGFSLTVPLAVEGSDPAPIGPVLT